MNRKITYEETIELFLIGTIYDINNEKEIPKINFIFNDDAYETFYKIMNNPVKLKNGWKPNITKENINYLKNSFDKNALTINIKDHIKFFTYLTEITNASLKMHNLYNRERIPRSHLINILKRIWLRMTPNDINNVEIFLKRQLEFTKTDIFNKYRFVNFNKKHIIGNFHEYPISIENSLNYTWDESTKCMSFNIEAKEISHTLPNIFYDIIDDTCYIYAIQNDKDRRINEIINKLIYKEYRGKGQPNKVYALKLFINMLKKEGIKKINIPTLQVLDYDYHEILSKNEIESFNSRWSNININTISKQEKYYYEHDLNWYNNIVNKKDSISKLKTEDLIKLIYRILEEDNELYLTNDIVISDTLNIKILKHDK